MRDKLGVRDSVRAVDELETMTYERDGRVARVTLDRPERGNGITLEMPRELADCVERANLDPEVHVIALAGNGTGFCGGYDLVASAERMSTDESREPNDGSPIDPATIAANHAPNTSWDPVTDFQMMSRNVRGFMSLFHSEKPVVCKVHGYCVAGGTDMALCSDLLVVADDAKIGYPPARVWGVPTTALWAYKLGPTRAKRLLLTGDSINGREAVSWGLATDWAPAAELDGVFESLLERVARIPVNQLVMHKVLVNQALFAQGLHATQVLGTFFDGIARHTPEGHEFVRKAATEGASRRPCASATSRSAITASSDEDSGHQLPDAVRPRHDSQARRVRPRGPRRRRLRPVARQPLQVRGRPPRLPARRARRPRRSSTTLEEIARSNGIEVIVPAFEEAFYISTQCDRLSTTATVFTGPFSTLARLHDKVAFQRLVTHLGLPIAETVVAADDAELAEAISGFDRYFARPAFSRGGVSLLTNTGPLAGATKLSDCHPTPQTPWLVQPFVDGDTFCTYRPPTTGRLSTHLMYRIPRQWHHTHRDRVPVDRRARVAPADRADRRRASLHRPDLVRLHRHRRRPVASSSAIRGRPTARCCFARRSSRAGSSTPTPIVPDAARR